MPSLALLDFSSTMNEINQYIGVKKVSKKKKAKEFANVSKN